MDEKKRLRTTMRALRREHVAGLPASMNALLFLRPPTPVAAMAPAGANVGLYHATGDEAPAGGYARWFLENGRHIALPWFATPGSAMTFRQWRDPFGGGDLVPGPFGLMQPSADAPEVVPQVLIVPGLAFTAGGLRLGQGGGHYDRWLALHPGVATIGLGWDCQIVERLPQEAHDIVLDAVVTPTRLCERTR